MEGVMIQNIHKAYERPNGESTPILCGIHMMLHPGECVSLIGDSGSGKSTLARLLLGMEHPDSGKLFIDGVPCAEWNFRQWRKYRRVIQGVFQDASGTLNPRMSVYHNMEEALRNLTDLDKFQRKKEILQLMEEVEIEQSLLETPARMLSGGQQRRVALLRALAVKPKYLVLDEVVSGLDILTSDAVLSTLKNYQERFGCAYLMITHDMESARQISDRILLIQNGRLCREATAITE